MIALAKPVRRRVDVGWLQPSGRRHSPLWTVEISPAGIRFREYGARRWLGPLPWGSAILRAAEITTGHAVKPRPRRRRRAA